MDGRNSAFDTQQVVNKVLGDENIVRRIVDRLHPGQRLPSALTSKTFHRAALRSDKNTLDEIYQKVPNNAAMLSNVRSKQAEAQKSHSFMIKDINAASAGVRDVAYALLKRMGAEPDGTLVTAALEVLSEIRTHPSIRNSLTQEDVYSKAIAETGALETYQKALDRHPPLHRFVQRIPPEVLLLALQLDRSADGEVRRFVNKLGPTSRQYASNRHTAAVAEQAFDAHRLKLWRNLTAAKRPAFWRHQHNVQSGMPLDQWTRPLPPLPPINTVPGFV